MTLPINQIICGDNIEVMKEWPNNCVPTIICDPPYGLSFMGKKWDYQVPSIEEWQECLRVLKPGGTLLCFAGSRTQHRMACNVEDAGFILKDCIMWLYGSGFPKATDLSLQFDKKACQEQLIEQLGRMPTKKEFDDAWKVFREVIGSYQGPADYKKAGRGPKTCKTNNWTPTGTTNWGRDLTAPATPEAQLWNGWKSHGLKPAYEPILVAMKPNEGSYAENALKWGVSGLNIDGGRIGYQSEKDKKIMQGGIDRLVKSNNERGVDKGIFNASKELKPNDISTGRFPANIILDEEAGRMLDEQSGVSKPSKGRTGLRGGSSWHGRGTIGSPDKEGTWPADNGGGASRFFYCAKSSKRERGEGNSHCCVKPLALMEYLCTLTKTPTGGIVLDPYCGSGTTCKAAQNTGRNFIGIDNNEEYCEIARQRLEAVDTGVPVKEQKKGQRALFPQDIK